MKQLAVYLLEKHINSALCGHIVCQDNEHVGLHN